MPELYFTKKGVEVSTSVNLPFIGTKLIKEVIPYTDFGNKTSSLITVSWTPIMEGEILIGLRVQYIEEVPSKYPIKISSLKKLPKNAKPITDFESKVYKKPYTLYETNEKYYLIRRDKELKSGPMIASKSDVQKFVDYVNNLPNKTIWMNVKDTNTKQLIGLPSNIIWIAEQIAEQIGLGETFLDERRRLHFKLKPTIFLNKDNLNDLGSQYQSKHSDLGLPPSSDKSAYNRKYYQEITKPKRERKKPYPHIVKTHDRSGNLVHEYERGEGEKPIST